MFQKALQSTYLFLSSHLLVASSVGACQWNFYFPGGLGMKPLLFPCLFLDIMEPLEGNKNAVIDMLLNR